MHRACVIGLSLAALSALQAGAQTLPYLAVPRPPDPACANALGAIPQTAVGLAPDSLKVLIAQVAPCRPELGVALGKIIRGVSTGGSEEQVAVAFSYSPPLVDSALFSAARDVAASSASGELARVSALIMMTYVLDRETVLSSESITSHPRGATVCASARDSDLSHTDIAGDYTPLPPDVALQAHSVAMSIQQDGSSSPAVLSASYCLLEAWRQSSGLPLNAHWSLSASSCRARRSTRRSRSC
jgi:hypothetical protein